MSTLLKIWVWERLDDKNTEKPLKISEKKGAKLEVRCTTIFKAPLEKKAENYQMSMSALVSVWLTERLDQEPEQ